MDELDRARKYQDQLNAAAIVKRKPAPELPVIGECHNCGAPVDHPQRFCDSDCSDEWEELQARRDDR